MHTDQVEEDIEKVVIDFVDYLLPELTPYETTLYLVLLRKSFLMDSRNEVVIGKRTLANLYGKGSRGERTNYAHISKLLDGLEQKECIKIGSKTREGTLYTVILPDKIPIVPEKIATTAGAENDEDYFTIPEKRQGIFERDDWKCFYCGEKVTSANITLDHYHPQHLGGNHSKKNLKTCCLTCNSIKSGKTYDEAAPFILKSIRERRARSGE